MFNNRKKTSLLIAIILFIVVLSIFLFLSRKFLPKISFGNNSPETNSVRNSPFAKFSETTASESPSPVNTNESIQNLNKKAMRIGALTQLADFNNTVENWRMLLEKDQHYATVDCPTEDLVSCNLDFLASSMPVFTPKYYSEVNLNQICSFIGTAYVVDNNVLIYGDSATLSNYWGRSLKLIITFNNEGFSFETDSLPKAEECIYYVE